MGVFYSNTGATGSFLFLGGGRLQQAKLDCGFPETRAVVRHSARASRRVRI